jgi:predicted transglutaminase-like cysteine proteinase
MRIVSRGLATVLVTAAIVFATTADAQIMRMDGFKSLLDQRPHEPFGMSTELAPAGPLWVKWRKIDDEIASDDAEVARCRADAATCSKAALTLIALIDEARTLDGRRQLGIVNRSLNLAIAYASDMSQHGVVDQWSSALASLQRGRGDCEDYAIAKYYVLRAAGVPAEDLRLLIAHNYSDGDAHAVLAVRRDGHWFILDNRKMVMLEDNGVRDLHPLFALDGGGVRRFVAPVVMAATQAAPVAASPAAATAQPPAPIAANGDLLPLLM